MEKKQLENIIKKYPSFKPKSKFSDKTLSLLLKRVKTNLSLEDVVAFYDKSSILKIKGLLLSVKGLHVLNEEDILFEKVKDVIIQNDALGIEYLDNSSSYVFLERKDRIVTKKLLEDIIKVRKTSTQTKKNPTTPNEARKNTFTENVGEDPIPYFNKAEELYSNEKYVESVKYYQKAADLNHTLSILYLGFAYEKGLGISQDVNKAKELYEKACKMKEPKAYYRLAFYYRYVEKNNQLSTRNFKIGADMGHPLSMNAYGICLRDGIGCDVNIEEAISYFEKGSNLNEMYSAYNLGCLYKNGKHVKQDFEKAITYLSKAATLGHVDACKQLYFIYFNNSNYPTNYNEALKWVNIGVEKGDSDCKVYKGTLYVCGAFGKDVFKEGYELLFEGAHSGNDLAKIWLIVQASQGKYKFTNHEFDEIIAYASSKEDWVKYIKEIKKVRYVMNPTNPHPSLQSLKDAYNAKDKKKIKDIINHCIEHKYVADQQYYNELSNLMRVIMDDDYEYVLEAQDQIDKIYNQNIMDMTKTSYEQALKYYENKEYIKALNEFEKVYDAGRKEVSSNIADIYYEQKDYENALNWYMKSNGYETKVKIAEIYVLQGKIEEAKKILINNAHSSSLARDALIKHLLKKNFTCSDKMIPYVKQAIKSSKLSQKQIEELQQILEEFENVNKKETLLSKAQKHEYHGRSKQALELYLEYLREFNDSQIMLKVAFLYKEMNDYSNYFEYLFSASEYDNAEACYYLAHYYKDCEEEKLYKTMLEKSSELGYEFAQRELKSFNSRKNRNIKGGWKVEANNNCSLCEYCIDYCFIGLISVEKGKLVINSNGCIGCGQCVIMCPRRALSIKEVK